MVTSNAEHITSTYHILSLLQRARTAHAVVSLRRPHEQLVYNSTILAVNSQPKTLVIDAPAESQIPLQAKAGDWLKLRIKLQGLVLSFDACIEDIQEDASSSRSYRLQLPSQVYYQQRRDAFRASVGYQFNATFSAQLNEKQHLTARITDLSLGGASIELEAATVRGVKNDTPLFHCSLQMDKETIRIETATIRAIQVSEHSMDIYRLGIAFNDLSASERRNLQRWVMKFDRENRKSALPE